MKYIKLYEQFVNEGTSTKVLNKEIEEVLKQLFGKQFDKNSMKSMGKFYEFYVDHPSDKKKAFGIGINFAKKNPNIVIKLTDETGENVHKEDKFDFSTPNDVGNILQDNLPMNKIVKGFKAIDFSEPEVEDLISYKIAEYDPEDIEDDEDREYELTTAWGNDIDAKTPDDAWSDWSTWSGKGKEIIKGKAWKYEKKGELSGIVFLGDFYEDKVSDNVSDFVKYV